MKLLNIKENTSNNFNENRLIYFLFFLFLVKELG